ncbi:hypothetical protein RJ641_010993 [Dillenia turbinata]|uniref:Uncharacterized protein n=1 Tax=Dillenia turbinata TaxID=194707 RepID=A0AAN8UXN4_9MAGN
MVSYVKSIDRNHLPEAGLEGFYGGSSPQRMSLNPSFNRGTDFRANNRIPGIDFATVHSYPDQWLSSLDDLSQLSFMNNWISMDSFRDGCDIVLSENPSTASIIVQQSNKFYRICREMLRSGREQRPRAQWLAGNRGKNIGN